MDAQAKKKALFRAKLKAQKQEKQRIDSPLVRYSEHDQPVCRVCDVVIKSESLWPAHQASRKHHEAINKFKADAAALNRPSVAKSESAKEFPNPKPEPSTDLIDKSEPSTALPTHKSSTLPPNFFDNHDNKRQKNKSDSINYRDFNSQKKDSLFPKTQVSGSGPGRSYTDPEVDASKDLTQVSATATGLEANQVKGPLPAGFFDDKDADLRARGIKPVKPDVKDEYREFEKLIQEDLQEVDNRFEEEEFVAAEVIEQEETVEQRAYIERVERLRKKKLELRASKAAVIGRDTEVTAKKSSHEDSSSDEDNAVKVDWRSKHL